MQQNTCPKSASHPIVVSLGFITLLGCIVFEKFSQVFESNIVTAVFFCVAMTGGVIFALDFFWQKVHLRPTTGLDFSLKNPSWNRTLIKLIGLVGSLWFVGLLYWLFPEYHGDFYNNYWRFLRLIAPFWAATSIPYFYFVDQKMLSPKDGYWNMGQVLLLNFEEVNGAVLWQHLLGWLIKGFFLPLMLTYFCRDLDKVLHFDFATIVDFKTFFEIDNCRFQNFF